MASVDVPEWHTHVTLAMCRNRFEIARFLKTRVPFWIRLCRAGPELDSGGVLVDTSNDSTYWLRPRKSHIGQCFAEWDADSGMKQLPIAARIYVSSVIAGGAVLLAVLFPVMQFQHPAWFVTLLLLSSITSAFKVNLPLARSGSTMSVSYAVDFLSLILLGPAQTMIVGAISAWAQCTFRTSTKNQLYRKLFSMASLVICVQAAGAAFHALGGVAGLTSMPLAAMAKPLLGAAGAYFLCNTALVATAIAFSTRQNIMSVWNENFLWSAPSYFVGAVAAA